MSEEPLPDLLDIDDLDLQNEFAEILAKGKNVRIERIVSKRHASQDGFWYDQDQAEWIVVVQGSAELEFASPQRKVTLLPLEHLLIPAHCRHRVVWTSTSTETIWLAVFFDATN